MRREVSYYIREKKRTASTELAHVLKKCIGQIDRPWKEIIILCIGSDRITGDSLGPLIGQQLSRHRWKNIHIYGTLDAPVHALNLESVLADIKKKTSICADSRSGCLSRLSETYRVYHRRYRADSSRIRSTQKSPSGWRSPYYRNS